MRKQVLILKVFGIQMSCIFLLIQFIKIMINWPSFVYTAFPFFYPPLQLSTSHSLVTLGQQFSKIEKTETINFLQDCLIENEEKLKLTQQDLKDQSYETKKKPWSQDEDKRLIDLYEKRKLSWEEIAKKIPGRNKKMCYSRYRRLQSGIKVQWTNREKEKLNSLIKQHGQNWKLISDHLKNRTPKQIKEHYKNYIRPDLDKSEWSLEDDLKLIELINQKGKNWKLIQTEMPHRSLNQIKNRFFGKLKKLNASLYGISDAF